MFSAVIIGSSRQLVLSGDWYVGNASARDISKCACNIVEPKQIRTRDIVRFAAVARVVLGNWHVDQPTGIH